MVVRCFKGGGSDIHGIPSIVVQRVCVTAEVARVENVAQPSGGGLVGKMPGVIVEPDVDVEGNNMDWDLDGIMTAKNVEASRMQAKNGCTAGEMSLWKQRGSS